MAKKQSIQTNLLGRAVRIGDFKKGPFGPPIDAVNQEGEIVNVFYDNDGDLKYTIRIVRTGKLINLYQHDFLI